MLSTRIFVGFFKVPPLTTLTTHVGRWAWVGLISMYLAITFPLAAGIPNLSDLTSIVAAFCTLQFQSTFSSMLTTMFWIKEAALRDGEGFDLVTAVTAQRDSGAKRLVRGFVGQGPKQLAFSVFNIFYFLGALVLDGRHSAIASFTDAYRNSTTSFVCTSPLEGAGEDMVSPSIVLRIYIEGVANLTLHPACDSHFHHSRPSRQMRRSYRR